MVNLEVQNILVEETELRQRAGVANCIFTPHIHTHYYLIVSTYLGIFPSTKLAEKESNIASALHLLLGDLKFLANSISILLQTLQIQI